VLVGEDDARRVFRLTDSSLKELNSINKEDPFGDDRLDMQPKVQKWYYLRDVWQKSSDIYGVVIVNAWYERFEREVADKVSYGALYGLKKGDIVPKETPLLRWIFSQKLNEILHPDSNAQTNTIEGGGDSVVKRALRANLSKLGITYALYLYTSSYSLWAETLHSVCDATNQGLLFLSIRMAATEPSWNHPYGYGASRWVVSFLSGTVLCGMGLGAMVGSAGDIIFGTEHADITDVRLGIALCMISATLEMYSFLGALREIRSHADEEKITIKEYLQHGTDSTSVHVFLEDGTGLFCSVLAGGALTLTHFTNYSTVLFDVFGSFIIGGTLTGVGLVMMVRNAKLLSGRSVKSTVLTDVIDYLHTRETVASYHDIKSMIVGMNTCVIKVEVNFNADCIAEKYINTTMVFPQFQKSCGQNDLDAFHDLMMKSCADYQQWLVKERTQIEMGIKAIVKGYGYDRVHVDIETF